MGTLQRLGIALAIASVPAIATPVAAQVTIDNGIAGDGRWEVVSASAGDSTSGSLDPVGPAPLGDVIYELYTYVDTEADGAAGRLADSTTSPATLTGPNQVTSSGSFAGPNGSIDWTAVATVPAGQTRYGVTLHFTSASPFGTVRLISYFDEDVVAGDQSDDVLVVLGTPGHANFFLLTLDQVDDVGVGHAAGFLSSLNATYVGWAADSWPNLQLAIGGAGATYSIPGTINTVNLPPYVEPRYPGSPAYGPRDITQAFAFDLDPGATSATIEVSLAGSPDGLAPLLSDGFESGTASDWSAIAP